jgi:hypothetical protein
MLRELCRSENFVKYTKKKRKIRKKNEEGGVKKKNSVVLVRKRTIPTKRPQPADEVSANFS